MADVTSPFGFPYPESTDLVRNGAEDIEALAQAANDQFSAGFQFAGQRIYESSGTFLKADPLGTGDIGLRAVRVTCVGGGGSGGGAAATSSAQGSAGSGGGGGGFSQKFYLASELSASESVTRGAGGAAVSGSGGGNAGTASTFKSVSAGGGSAGSGTVGSRVPTTVTPGLGGAASGGDINIVGSGGATGLRFGGTNGEGDGLSTASYGGSGGSSVLGGGGAGVNRSSAGVVGGLFGGGGGGGANAQDQLAVSSGAGANGIVIVEVFV